MSRTSESGMAHIIPIVAVVVIIGAVGFFAWNNLINKSADVAMDAATKQARDECEKDNDKDICRFLTSWKLDQKYRMTSVDGQNKTVFEIDGNKTHMMTSGEMAYDVISIDKTTYTKSGDVWYKQTIKDASQDVTAGGKVEFDEPSDKTDEKDLTTYKKLGKEACGKLTCFKYEVVDPKNTDSKEFIWFDDQDYKLRRTLSQTPDGNSEATFDYENVTVKVPSPVKELQENQYIVPGQTEPQTMPAASDLSQLQ